ncbi:MAG: DUF3604 domain-containing protein [Myxococcota bacterium]|nr:DUF3604 domain-containing protein [Myxococcota bacterium]
MAVVTLLSGACGDEPGLQAPAPVVLPPLGPLSADAHPEVVESLVEDLAAPRHASDGGGRAWLEEVLALTPGGDFVAVARSDQGVPIVEAESRNRFHLVYEAGPLGVANGGTVFLQISPFWEWDDPQTEWDDASGYTEVSTTAEGVLLDSFLVAPQLMVIEVRDRGLEPGERIQIVYGAGAAGARVDRFAESVSQLWIAVDGDGDGIRSLLADSPSVLVRASQPAWLIATVTSTAEPGDEVHITLALLDSEGNADPRVDGRSWQGEITLEAPGVSDLPERVALSAADRGRKSIVGRAEAEGIHRLRFLAETERGVLAAESNPLVVRRGVRRVLWADLHGHSHLSDGTGTPSDFYDYARSVAALDVAALTDHDHWGLRFLDANPEMWSQIRAAAKDNYEPGRFVTLLGYEWTSWLQGHRHVLYFRDEGEVISSIDPRFDTPDELWGALEGQPALTFAHHSAGGPVSTNWTYAPPPELEPVTEIVSVHGSSEAPDSPQPIYSPVAGNSVRDALKLGYRFGFIGSSDSHDGHPGLAWVANSGASGLAALYAEERTRDAVLAALRARATYATNGPRIYLDVRLAPPTDAHTQLLHYEVAGTAPIEAIDFIRTGLTASLPSDGDDVLDWKGEREIPALGPGEYVYLRVRQVDGAAWSSPFYGPEREPHTD